MKIGLALRAALALHMPGLEATYRMLAAADERRHRQRLLGRTEAEIKADEVSKMERWR